MKIYSRRHTFNASNVKGDKCVEFKFSFLNIFIPENNLDKEKSSTISLNLHAK